MKWGQVVEPSVEEEFVRDDSSEEPLMVGGGNVKRCVSNGK